MRTPSFDDTLCRENPSTTPPRPVDSALPGAGAVADIRYIPAPDSHPALVAAVADIRAHCATADAALGIEHARLAMAFALHAKRSVAHAPENHTGSCCRGAIRMPNPSAFPVDGHASLGTVWAVTLLHECVHSARDDMPGARHLFAKAYLTIAVPLLMGLFAALGLAAAAFDAYMPTNLSNLARLCVANGGFLLWALAMRSLIQRATKDARAISVPSEESVAETGAILAAKALGIIPAEGAPEPMRLYVHVHALEAQIAREAFPYRLVPGRFLDPIGPVFAEAEARVAFLSRGGSAT